MVRVPTEADRVEALRRLLSGLTAGSDVHELTVALADPHPKNNTFPGEVFMDLAADVLEVVGATRGEPIAYEGLREAYLPECEFRGRENRKIQFAVLTRRSAARWTRAGPVGRVIWWPNDDYWRYALYAAVGLIRAAQIVEVSPFLTWDSNSPSSTAPG